MKKNKQTLSQRRRKATKQKKKHDKDSKNRPKRLLSFKRGRAQMAYTFNKKRIEEIQKILKEQSEGKESIIENK